MALETYENGVDNLAFIGEVIKVLPHETRIVKKGREDYYTLDRDRYFEASVQATALRLQQSIIWVSNYYRHRMHAYPHYVVGAAANDEDISLLVHAAYSSGEIRQGVFGYCDENTATQSPLFRVEVPREDFVAFTQRATSSYSPSALAKVYKSDKKLFRIRSTSPGSTFLDPDSPRRAKKRDERQVMRINNRSYLGLLTDADLLHFHVYDYTNQLSLFFGIRDQIVSVIRQKATQDGESVGDRQARLNTMRQRVLRTFTERAAIV